MYNLQKTSAWGEDWARTDIVLSSPDDDRILPLQFWSDHMDLVKSVTIRWLRIIRLHVQKLEIFNGRHSVVAQ